MSLKTNRVASSSSLNLCLSFRQLTKVGEGSRDEGLLIHGRKFPQRFYSAEKYRKLSPPVWPLFQDMLKPSLLRLSGSSWPVSAVDKCLLRCRRICLPAQKATRTWPFISFPSPVASFPQILRTLKWSCWLISSPTCVPFLPNTELSLASWFSCLTDEFSFSKENSAKTDRVVVKSEAISCQDSAFWLLLSGALLGLALPLKLHWS